MTYLHACLPFYNLLTYLPTIKKIIRAKIWPTKMTSQENNPNHNGHVEMDLSKMMEWSFWHLFKLGTSLLDLLVKKYPCFLVVTFEGMLTCSTCIAKLGRMHDLQIFFRRQIKPQKHYIFKSYHVCITSILYFEWSELAPINV
jgi:hypothetical protein